MNSINDENMDESNRLMSEGFKCLEDSDPKAALKIGEKLESMQFSGGFEIQARAYEDMNEKKKAIKVLQRGVLTVPNVWQLWQLLGNYYSNFGQPEKAYSAFEGGLSLDNPDYSSLYYNFALALERNGEFKKARDTLSKISDSSLYSDEVGAELYLLIFKLKLSLLRENNEPEAVICKLTEHETVLLDKNGGDYPERMASIYAEVAHSYYVVGEMNNAETRLKDSIFLDNRNAQAQWLYREMRKGQAYQDAISYEVRIHGVLNEPCDGGVNLVGFFKNYNVVADNQEEAMEIIKYFEPKDIHSSIAIDEIKVIDKNPNQPKGIYFSGEYSCYDEDPNDNKG